MEHWQGHIALSSVCFFFVFRFSHQTAILNVMRFAPIVSIFLPCLALNAQAIQGMAVCGNVKQSTVEDSEMANKDLNGIVLKPGLNVVVAAAVMTALASLAAPLPQPEFAYERRAVRSFPPAWLYEPAWDMACVIVRGAEVGGEMGEVKDVIDGTVLKLR